MKLGRDTGSVTNWMMSGSKQQTPKVGDGATVLCWTDRHAATIIEVSKSGKRLVVQYDKCTRLDKNGMSEDQSYVYTRDVEGITRTFSLRKTGRWVESGTKNGSGLLIGHRESYHDYSF